MDNKIVLTACAIIPALMERRHEYRYSDESAIHEAYRLAEDYFSHTRKTPDAPPDSQNHTSTLKSQIADAVCAELLISKHEAHYKRVLSAIECATSDFCQDLSEISTARAIL